MTANPVLELAPAWRWRCFGASENRKAPCTRPASQCAPDTRRHDALTFWCDEHAPASAKPIEANQPFVELAIAGLVIIGGATVRHQDAGLEAVMAVQVALGKLGGTFAAATVNLALRTAVPIIGGNRASEALGGARSDER